MIISETETKTPTQTRNSIARTITPTLMTSPTLAPTLSGREQKDYLFELLKTNANCRLPCWWSIHPGETTWQDAHRLLIYMGLPVYNTLLPDGSIFHSSWTTLDGSVNNNFDFYEKQNRVEFISIRVQEGYRNPALVFKFWRSYSPEQIIKDYGQPTRIMTNLFGTETGKVFYYLFLFFDDQGILAFYQGTAGRPDEINYRVCPTWQDSTWLPFLEMYLQSPDSQIPLELLAQLSSNPQPLDLVSQTTIEEFTASILSQTGASCFDTLQSIWP